MRLLAGSFRAVAHMNTYLARSKLNVATKDFILNKSGTYQRVRALAASLEQKVDYQVHRLEFIIRDLTRRVGPYKKCLVVLIAPHSLYFMIIKVYLLP